MILESNRSLQQTNMKSFFIILDKNWCRFNDLEKGKKLKLLSGASVCVIISPNSPIYSGEGLERFKKELSEW